jgi:3-deoxy-D-manno-octulosonic-acid transferase
MYGLYRFATSLGAPFVRGKLRTRAANGKEDPERLDERLGQASKARPAGPLVWLHAASVGETVSVLPLIDALIADPALTVLITSGTVTSAKVIEPHLSDRVIHQYVPVDLVGSVRAFLDHWKPDLAILVESELWPNLITETQAHDVPMVMIQARLSDRSWRRWRRWRGTIGKMLAGFPLVIAQTETDAERFRSLGAPAVTVSGTLKYVAQPLDSNLTDLKAFQRMAGARPVWLAASTHAGEEDAVMTAHIETRARVPDLLTIIVPRHPARAAEVIEIAAARGLDVSQRTDAQPIKSGTAIYLADTLGELGLFYRMAPVAFVGGSLIDVGGHNLIEPIQLGCAVLCGPHLANMAEVAEDLEGADALRKVTSAHELSEQIALLLGDTDARLKLVTAQKGVLQKKAEILSLVTTALKPYLPRQRAGARA